MPKDVKPMLATLVDKPFDEPGWLYQVKWDGYRALAYLNNGDVDILFQGTIKNLMRNFIQYIML